MNVKYLKTLVVATALGAGALAYSGPADAYVRGCGSRPHYWHHAWHRCGGPVVGCGVAPVVASDYVAPAPVVAAPACTTGCGRTLAGYGGWGGGGLLGGLFPF